MWFICCIYEEYIIAFLEFRNTCNFLLLLNNWFFYFSQFNLYGLAHWHDAIIPIIILNFILTSVFFFKVVRDVEQTKKTKYYDAY